MNQPLPSHIYSASSQGSMVATGNNQMMQQPQGQQRYPPEAQGQQSYPLGAQNQQNYPPGAQNQQSYPPGAQSYPLEPQGQQSYPPGTQNGNIPTQRDPCFGSMSLQTACQLVGLFGVIFGVIRLGWYGYEAVSIAALGRSKKTPYKAGNIFLGLYGTAVFTSLIKAILNGLLIFATFTRNTCLCWTWICFTVFDMIYHVVAVSIIVYFSKFNAPLIGYVVIILLETYFVVVIVYYVRDLSRKVRSGPPVPEPEPVYSSPMYGPLPAAMSQQQQYLNNSRSQQNYGQNYNGPPPPYYSNQQ